MADESNPETARPRKAFYVYEHWRPDTGQCFYVGKGSGRRSHDFTTRNSRHKRIVAKLARLGFAVEVRVVFSSEDEDAVLTEERAITVSYRAQGHGLCNLVDGGKGGFNPSEETREKMRRRSRAQILSPETRAKIGAAHRGMKRPEGTGAKISAALKGKNLSAEHCTKLAAAKLGKKRMPHSEETKAKMRAAAVGRPKSPQHVSAMRASWELRRLKQKER